MNRIGGYRSSLMLEFEFKTSFLSFLEPEKNEKGTTKSVWKVLKYFFRQWKKYLDQILEILIKNHCQFSFYWCYNILWTKFVFLQTEPSKARSLRKSKLSIVTPTKTELTVILGQNLQIWPPYACSWTNLESFNFSNTFES